MNRTAPFVGTGVQEYVISQAVSAFRHWAEPASVQSATDAAIDVTQCFTSMTFTTDAVAGVPLDVAGASNLIWGYHDSTFLKGYHGYTKKGTLHNFTATGPESDDPVDPRPNMSNMSALLNVLTVIMASIFA